MEQQIEVQNELKNILEAILFVNETPVTFEQIKKIFPGTSPSDIKKAINDLNQEYEQNGRGMILMEIAGGYQLLSNKKYASFIREFYKTKHKAKLSKPSLETLAIIAYKQPVTRVDIELIRGVNSDGVIMHLIDKELIKTVGRKDIPGKPFLYGTTKQFLEYFGLKSLEDLPKLEEFPKLKPEYEKDMVDDSTQEGEARLEETTEEKGEEPVAVETASQTQDEQAQEENELN